MAKEIRYPTQEWLDKWVDQWCDEHPNERVSDFSQVYALADEAWWRKEIDADRPTPFDLTAEQEKESKDARRTPGGQGKDRAPVKSLSNVERSLDFVKDGKHYTLTLTEHRQPKG